MTQLNITREALRKPNQKRRKAAGKSIRTPKTNFSCGCPCPRGVSARQETRRDGTGGGKIQRSSAGRRNESPILSVSEEGDDRGEYHCFPE